MTPAPVDATSSKRQIPRIYLVMIASAVAIFLVLRHYGENYLTAPASVEVGISRQPQATHGRGDLYHVLLAMATVIVAGRLLGIAFRWFKQPRVIGEMVAGILLGPSFLGWISPEARAYLLPDDITPLLQVLAQLGVILYMFLVGLELNTGLLRERGEAMVAVSHASIVAPFLLGSCLAVFVYSRWSTSDVSFTVFALFFGVSMSVTAFPVLARILSERGLSQTPLGSMALACAAADDVTAWCLLALVVGVAQAKLEDAVLTLIMTAAYLVLMFLVVRPLMSRLIARQDAREPITQGQVAFVFVALLLSSLATELIGIHAIFGAFLLGAVIPHDSRVAREFLQKLEDIVAVLLLPAFFALTGLRTHIGLVSGWENVLLCAGIISIATIGKFAGSAVAGRLTGMTWRDSAAIGILMNTRGLMELIVLNIGLDLGVISPTLFAMLVLMALVTTFATAPVLDLLVPRSDA